jgi:hypothetical protein
MIRHMALLGALAAGAFGGRQRGDGLQLRLVPETESVLANRKSRITRWRAATHNVRANAPSHDFGYLRIRSPVLTK